MKLIEMLKGSNKIICGGHRGHKSDLPGNSIRNYEQIKFENIPYIEIDVQITKDKVSVIYHDYEFLYENNRYNIKDFELIELKKMINVDTLNETIHWCKKNNMIVALEVKFQPFSMSEDEMYIIYNIVNCLREFNYFEYSFVFGLNYKLLYKMKEIEPKVNLGLIVPFVPRDSVKLMKDMKALIYLSYYTGLSKDLVTSLKKEGFFVDGSVINNKTDLENVINLGVNMIESDYPIELRDLINDYYES